MAGERIENPAGIARLGFSTPPPRGPSILQVPVGIDHLRTEVVVRHRTNGSQGGDRAIRAIAAVSPSRDERECELPPAAARDAPPASRAIAVEQKATHLNALVIALAPSG